MKDKNIIKCKISNKLSSNLYATQPIITVKSQGKDRF